MSELSRAQQNKSTIEMKIKAVEDKQTDCFKQIETLQHNKINSAANDVKQQMLQKKERQDKPWG